MAIYNTWSSIKEQIIKHAENNSSNNNIQLPSEITLSEMYDVSRSTIREILAQLIQEGVVYKIKGKGSFIRQGVSKLSFNINNLCSVNLAIKNIGLTPSTRIIYEKKINVDKYLSEKLGLNEGESCTKIERLRYANDKIAVYSKHYFKTQLLGEISDETLNGSIFEHLDRIGIFVAYSKTKISSSILTKYQLPELGSEISSFLLLEEVYYRECGEIIGYSNDYYSDSIFSFELIRKRII